MGLIRKLSHFHRKTKEPLTTTKIEVARADLKLGGRVQETTSRDHFAPPVLMLAHFPTYIFSSQIQQNTLPTLFNAIYELLGFNMALKIGIVLKGRNGAYRLVEALKASEVFKAQPIGRPGVQTCKLNPLFFPPTPGDKNMAC